MIKYVNATLELDVDESRRFADVVVDGSIVIRDSGGAEHHRVVAAVSSRVEGALGRPIAIGQTITLDGPIRDLADGAHVEIIAVRPVPRAHAGGHHTTAAMMDQLMRRLERK